MSAKTVLKRFGSAIFFFYLIKGLVWLVIFGVAGFTALKTTGGAS